MSPRKISLYVLVLAALLAWQAPLVTANAQGESDGKAEDHATGRDEAEGSADRGDETSGQQETAWSARDAATTARIESAYLFNDQLNPLRINTTTSNGVVTLEGEVDDEIEKELAESIARAAEGVTEVKNNLRVAADAESASTDAPEETGWASWRRAVDDAGVTAAVKSRLAYHSGLKTLKIDVDTSDGAVTLTGTVNSEEDKRAAGRLARQTRGVRSVNNELTVAPAAIDQPKTDEDEKAGKEADAPAEQTASEETDSSGDIMAALSDEWIEKRVETSIIFTSQISMVDLDVEVDGGACTITGTTVSEQQKALAGAVARDTDGVTSVNNQIQVVDWEDSQAE